MSVLQLAALAIFVPIATGLTIAMIYVIARVIAVAIYRGRFEYERSLRQLKNNGVQNAEDKQGQEEGR